MSLPFGQAKWISSVEHNVNKDRSLLFRKTFFLKQTVREAILSVICLGYGVCSINGEKVTNDVLTTPFSGWA